MKHLILAALAGAIAAGTGYASRPANLVVVTVRMTPANSGKAMYASYCSSCHGLDGKGDGPTAAMLQRQPADLTVLAKRNRGRFPTEHVQAVLEFGAASPGRGNSPMPVWGPILRGLDTAYPGQNMGMLRIVNLSQYLESIQEK